MKKLSTIIFASILLVGLATGCKREQKPAEDEKAELVLLTGSSFVEPAKKLCEEFTEKTGIEIVTTQGESEDLLPHVKAGKKGDIFVTHDPYLDYVKDADALANSVHVGYVAPVVAVQPGNPENIKSIEDLTKPGIKVALSNPEYSTCGRLVFDLLEKKGIKNNMMENVGNRLTKGHHRLGTLLKTKTVDAVIMWNGVAHTFADSLEIVPTPYEYDEEIRVHVMTLSYSKHLEAIKKFHKFASGRGPEIFEEYGYVK